MSGAWLVETSVVTFWLMSVQLMVWSLTLAPGLADSNWLIRSRQNPSVLSEYSGTSSEISPSTLPEAEPPDSSSEPPQAATPIVQSATASAAASDVSFLIATSPLASEAVVHSTAVAVRPLQDDRTAEMPR